LSLARVDSQSSNQHLHEFGIKRPTRKLCASNNYLNLNQKQEIDILSRAVKERREMLEPPKIANSSNTASLVVVSQSATSENINLLQHATGSN